jgi:Fe2+ or Zn2+ uptake regulation protein
MSPLYIDQLKELLQSKGIRPSHQRLKILEYLVENKEHPTVLMVHDALSKEIPTLSRTTIYNTLNVFAKEGLALPLHLAPDETRYDGTTTLHHHFICTTCGKIYDTDVRCPYSNSIAGGHRIEEVYGHFRGTCSTCQQGQSTHEL